MAFYQEKLRGKNIKATLKKSEEYVQEIQQLASKNTELRQSHEQLHEQQQHSFLLNHIAATAASPDESLIDAGAAASISREALDILQRGDYFLKSSKSLGMKNARFLSISADTRSLNWRRVDTNSKPSVVFFSDIAALHISGRYSNSVVLTLKGGLVGSGSNATLKFKYVNSGENKRNGAVAMYWAEALATIIGQQHGVSQFEQGAQVMWMFGGASRPPLSQVQERNLETTCCDGSVDVGDSTSLRLDPPSSIRTAATNAHLHTYANLRMGNPSAVAMENRPIAYASNDRGSRLPTYIPNSNSEKPPPPPSPPLLGPASGAVAQQHLRDIDFL